MAITTAAATSGKKDFLDGVNLAADEYKMALYTDAAALGAGTTAYSATNEVANGNGYTTGGIVLTGRATSIDGTTAILTFTSPQWTASTITARGCVIYNNTKAGKNAIAVYDFGQNVSSTNGTFTVTIPVANATTGLYRNA